MAVALPDRPPLTSPAARELYGRMEPYAHADPTIGWPMAWLCEAIGSQFEDVDDVAIQGWAYLTNPDLCPAWWLPHLAMWAGVQLDTGLPEADQRMQIREMVGLRRGTPAAMIAAAQPYLSGERRVRMVERNGGNAYEVLVQTYRSETPESTWGAVRRNLIKNPRLAEDDTGWKAKPNPVGGTVTVSERAAMPDDTSAYGWRCHGESTSNSWSMEANGDGPTRLFPVTEGQLVTLSFDAYVADGPTAAEGAGIGASIYWFEANEDAIPGEYAPVVTAVESGRQRIVYTFEAPADAAFATPGARVETKTSGDTIDVYFTNFRATTDEDDTAGVYFDGDTPMPGYEQVAWTGTAHASTSEAVGTDSVVHDALMSQKPAGVRLIYQVIDGWTYGELAEAYEGQDYADLAAAFADYEELRTVIPE